MIDVIIPVYNDNKNLRYCLASIAMQTTKNIITVHVIDDASCEPYSDIINDFSHELDIKYYKLEKNVGAGMARQYGLDHSNNQYVCFVDSDDVLYNPKSIENLFKNMKEGIQYTSGITYDEKYDMYTCDDNDLHGKMYLRKFLVDNNIKFNNTRIHDSSYFNNLVLICNPVKSICRENIYFYSDNKQSTSSISRRDYFKGLVQFFYNTREILNFAEKNNCNRESVDHFITNKKEYFGQLYTCSREYEKKQLDEWINKYNLQEITK